MQRVLSLIILFFGDTRDHILTLLVNMFLRYSFCAMGKDENLVIPKQDRLTMLAFNFIYKQ